MAENINSWLDRFEMDAGIKNSIILHGNSSDIVCNPKTNQYEPLLQSIITKLNDIGYRNIVKWDRIEGIDYNILDAQIVQEYSEESSENDTSNSYSFEDTDEQSSASETVSLNSYKDIEEFFSFLYQSVKGRQSKTAYILDYSDYIFGNANALSENERNWLSVLGKALQESNKYNMISDSFNELSNIIILVTKKQSYIPPSYYLDNSMVSSINIPLPSRKERDNFLKSHMSIFRLDGQIQDINSIHYNDFVDALDGFTIKDIAQMMKLSYQFSQKNDDRLSYEKLINLYKYGEKTSPWEELSKEKLHTIEDRLSSRVKGQDDAISKVKDVIIRAYTGFSGLQHSSKQKKPKGTLFFVGPTGVGKTELAKSLAEFLFGDENACIRFDMSEFNHEHSDQRLVGAPPGYVGFEEGGQLTNAIKERPFCVLLFDEIEKAHDRILDKFLQILEDGRLTDGKGETVYFQEAVIIFTSNIGASKVQYSELAEQDVQTEFIKHVREHFIDNLGRPEILNRIGDNIVAFNFIDNDEVFQEIIRVKFKAIEKFVEERYRMKLEFEDADMAYKAISKKVNVNQGGRGILNVLESSIVNPLSNYIFENYERLSPGRRIQIVQSSPKRAFFDFEIQ